ncbi:MULTISPECIES: hypothetical protein [Streptomyces]|nr:hypothetical protein [Streptomyces olivochromogenes]
MTDTRISSAPPAEPVGQPPHTARIVRPDRPAPGPHRPREA